MGIPKFYRWISERYPCLSEKIREYQIPDFDNLYLDMNGIIHTCSHPNDDDVHLRIPEDMIFREIFRYIDFLFKMIKPRKVFFMAIDGVAPRAKMNQQRGRRFRSAKLANDQEAEALKKGEKLPSEERFDSNCITPGTAFMARLHEQLQYFVKVKVTTDPLWQREGLVVYLSGHDVPGEGEHKIMDYIRHIRSKPGYDAETRHCLYGLDADLIMLGLSTHELHFSLLREEVKFGNFKKKRRQNPFHKSNQEVPDSKTTIDLANASLFKDIESAEITNSGGQVDGATILSAIVKGDLSYAGAAKIEEVPQSVDVVSELSTIEASLIPDAKGTKKDAYHPPLPEKTTFLLLHLSLLRDYIDEEFKPLREDLKDRTDITYDLEKVIDDWILMSILVGNDFVPNLPHLHINTNALPMLYDVYFKVLPKLGGYLNENGKLVLDRFEIFLRELSTFDVEHFRATYDDMKYMASKTGKNIVLGDNMMKAFEFDEDDGIEFKEEALEGSDETNGVNSELMALINRTDEEVFGADNTEMKEEAKGETALEVFPVSDGLFDVEDSAELRLEFAQSKRHYYMTKMDFKEVKKEVDLLAREYVRAIQWVLLYYYKGVSSWCWYYPAHYAPFASDVRDFQDVNITFDKGQPFKPFEQLLAVLPSQSKKLLPECYQWLMTNELSPIIKYYPEKFEQDLNGKKQDWEAVILIPFIDETQLLNAMQPEMSKLTSEEVFRNARGKLLLYSYKDEDTGPIVSPGDKFPRLSYGHVHIDEMVDVPYNPQTLPSGIHPRAKKHAIYQGFPTLKSIPHTSYLMDAQVKVFEMTARDVSLVMDLGTPESKNSENTNILAASTVAKKLIGKTVWVNWPHLTPALVTGVSDKDVKYVEKNGKDIISIDPEFTPLDQNKVVDGLEKRHLTCKGIKLGNVDIVLWAKLMEGRKLRCDKNGQIIVDNLWGKVNHPFAYGTTITAEDQVTVFSMAETEGKNFVDFYKPGDKVFLLEKKLLGAEAVVVGHDTRSIKVKVDYVRPVYRNIDGEAANDIWSTVEKWTNDNYFSTHEAARMCDLDPYTFSKISGSIFVIVEKGGGSPKKKPRGFNRRGNGRSKNGEPAGPDDDDDLYIAQETKKVNVGLDLKFNKKNQKARGYTTKHSSDKASKWSYSSKTIELVKRYVDLFPDFVEYLSCSTNDKGKDCYVASEIFPDDPVGRIREIQAWVDGLGLRDSVQRVDLSSDILDDDEIQIVWNHILKCKLHAKPSLKISRNVPTHLIYKPGMNRGCVQPVPGQEFQVMERVICVDPSAGMALGARGTIVGIQEPQVKNMKETIEESFKATSATVLSTLIILPDPQPDVFDKASENYVTSAGTEDSAGQKEVMTVALKSFLGIAGEGESKSDILSSLNTSMKSSNSATQPGTDFVPTPKLVKVFPYQVINISESEVQEFVNEGESQRVRKASDKGYKNARNDRPQKNSRNDIPSLLSLKNDGPTNVNYKQGYSKPNFNTIEFVRSAEVPKPSTNPMMDLFASTGTAGSRQPFRPPKGKPTAPERKMEQPKQIQILKRPQAETIPVPSASNGNPIFQLLQTSLEQQRVKQTVEKPPSAAEMLTRGTSVSYKDVTAGKSKQGPSATELGKLLSSSVSVPKDSRNRPNIDAPNSNNEASEMDQQELLKLIQEKLPNPEGLLSARPEQSNSSQAQVKTLPSSNPPSNANEQIRQPQFPQQTHFVPSFVPLGYPQTFAPSQSVIVQPFYIPGNPMQHPANAMVHHPNELHRLLSLQPAVFMKNGGFPYPGAGTSNTGFTPYQQSMRPQPQQFRHKSQSQQSEQRGFSGNKSGPSMVPTQALRQNSVSKNQTKQTIQDTENKNVEIPQLLNVAPFPVTKTAVLGETVQVKREISVEQLLQEAEVVATRSAFQQLAVSSAGYSAPVLPASNQHSTCAATSQSGPPADAVPPKSRIAANFNLGI